MSSVCCCLRVVEGGAPICVCLVEGGGLVGARVLERGRKGGREEGGKGEGKGWRVGGRVKGRSGWNGGKGERRGAGELSAGMDAPKHIPRQTQLIRWKAPKMVRYTLALVSAGPFAGMKGLAAWKTWHCRYIQD